jgi:E3 ubiquitin-protein ligase SIAH1
VCAHAPCRCLDEACRFAASTAELLLHLAAAHGWPCFTKTSVRDIVSFTVEHRDGFNFVRAAAGNGQGPYHLFLLNTAMEDAGCAVNVVCIQPRAIPPSKEMMFELQYSRYKDVRDSSRQFVNHYQKSEFRVVCTDLSDGLPDPNDGFQCTD